MLRRTVAWGISLGLGGSLVIAACQADSGGREETGLEGLGLTSVQPSVAVPGTTLSIEGSSFLDQPLGVGWLRLAGS